MIIWKTENWLQDSITAGSRKCGNAGSKDTPQISILSRLGKLDANLKAQIIEIHE
jgi:hypothetical protein